MNLLLLDPHEIQADGTARVEGRRARHLVEVLRARAGATVRLGVVDGPLGTGTVLAAREDLVDLRCVLDREPPRADDVLLLAVQRPKVLLRLLASAASLGFARVVLFRSWRVEKSHLRSRAMRPKIQRAALLEGLEQAIRTRVPEVLFFPLFRPFVEDRLDGLGLPIARFTGHPMAPLGTERLRLAPGEPFALLLGPEGGLIPYEVERLEQHGFLTVSLGPHPLRTENALAALHGQLDLLRRRALMDE